jgi:hypothetical protein
MGESGFVGEIDHARGVEIRWADGAAGSGLRLDFLLHRHEPDIGVTQEDQAEDGGRVFGWLQVGSGPELVGGIPEFLFEFGVGVVGGGGFGPVHEVTYS